MAAMQPKEVTWTENLPTLCEDHVNIERSRSEYALEGQNLDPSTLRAGETAPFAPGAVVCAV